MTGRPHHQVPPRWWEVALAWCPPDDSPLLGGPVGSPRKVVGVIRATRSEQNKVTRRYDRAAPIYDLYTAPMEWFGTSRRRRRLVSQARGRVLEVGVGTGRNLAYYPHNPELTATDVSGAMLVRARRQAARLRRPATFAVADVAALPYPDGAFDTAVATCLFCSVADPVAGLRELGRGTKRDGRILLLEHVRPDGRVGGWLADRITPITRRLCGFRANRRTEDAVVAAGLRIMDIRREGIWRSIVAAPGTKGDQR